MRIKEIKESRVHQPCAARAKQGHTKQAGRLWAHCKENRGTIIHWRTSSPSCCSFLAPCWLPGSLGSEWVGKAQGRRGSSGACFGGMIDPRDPSQHHRPHLSIGMVRGSTDSSDPFDPVSSLFNRWSLRTTTTTEVWRTVTGFPSSGILLTSHLLFYVHEPAMHVSLHSFLLQTRSQTSRCQPSSWKHWSARSYWHHGLCSPHSDQAPTVSSLPRICPVLHPIGRSC